MKTLKRLALSNDPFVDAGLLALRLGFGLSMMALHGYSKLTGGPERWEGLGAQMQNLGIDFLPTFWGFMAMFSEFFCAIFVIIGVLFRPATALLVATMFVAAVRHLSLPPDASGSGISGAAHALEFLTAFLALYLTGPGKFTVSRLWQK